jgi:hypothetical protein
MADATGPDINQLANFARMSAQSSGSSGKGFDKMINPGAAKFAANNVGIFKGNICGPFGLRPKQGGMTAQLAYEAQVLGEKQKAAHDAFAAACAAAGPVAAGLAQVSMTDVYGSASHGLGQNFTQSNIELV